MSLKADEAHDSRERYGREQNTPRLNTFHSLKPASCNKAGFLQKEVTNVSENKQQQHSYTTYSCVYPQLFQTAV